MTTVVNKETFLETYNDYGADFMIEIIDIFFNEYKEKIDNIEDGIKEKDAYKLRFWAHKLKGSIKAFFAPIPAETAYSLEKLGAAEQFDSAESLLNDLRVQCTIFMNDLIEIKEELNKRA